MLTAYHITACESGLRASEVDMAIPWHSAQRRRNAGSFLEVHSQSRLAPNLPQRQSNQLRAEQAIAFRVSSKYRLCPVNKDAAMMGQRQEWASGEAVDA